MINLITLLLFNTPITMIHWDICNRINGRYSVIEDRIELCVKSKWTLAHEVWHKFYRTKLSNKEKQVWDRFSKSYEDRKYFISEYAMTNPQEDFADTFMYIYLKKDFKYQHKVVKVKRDFILLLIKKYE